VRVEAPELVFEAAPQHRLRNALRELWSFRGGVLAFAERDVRVKYKQAALGMREGLALVGSPRRFGRFLAAAMGQSVVAAGSVLGSPRGRRGRA
jgi:hypothetical protein